MKITFVTGNKWKWQIAKKAIEPYGVELEQEKIETPEPQSLDVKEVARYSAKYAADFLKKPVIVTDAGAEILALNNFPGPFLKYMNHWFQAEDILAMMENKEDRRVRCFDCLAFCEPNGEPVLFFSENWGRIADKADGEGTAMDKILIWNGMDRVQGLVSDEDMTDYWAKHVTNYRKFGEFITKEKVK